jgi:hypothetical protein
MNYLKTYQFFDPIVIITKLNRYKKVKYTLNKDNSIDVKGNVDLLHRNLTELPVKFGKVTGNFYCDNNLLTSLEHGPKTVTGNFNFAINKFPENIQEKIDNFKGTWQELLHLMNIWQSKKTKRLR